MCAEINNFWIMLVKDKDNVENSEEEPKIEIEKTSQLFMNNIVGFTSC